MKRKLLIIGFCLFYLTVIFVLAAVTQINLATQVHSTLPVANGGTGAATANANNFFAGPLLGSAAAPSFKNSHLLFPNIPLLPTRRWMICTSGAQNTYGLNGISGCSGSGGVQNSGAATSTNPVYNASISGTTSGNTASLGGPGGFRFDVSPMGQIMTGMSSTTNNRQWIMFGTATPGAVDDLNFHGLAFRYSTNAGDTHWQCVTNNGTSTSNFVDSGITPDTNLHKFQVYFDNGSSTSYFWIDGTSVCGAVTAQPPGNTQVETSASSCTTLLTGQSCQVKIAWWYVDGDK